MDLDLRIPVGLLFVAIGLVMTIFGLTSDPAIYAKSLGINVNLDWGIVELMFGSIMIAFGRSAAPHAKPVEVATAPLPIITPTTDLPPGPLPREKPPVPHG